MMDDLYSNNSKHFVHIRYCGVDARKNGHRAELMSQDDMIAWVTGGDLTSLRECSRGQLQVVSGQAHRHAHCACDKLAHANNL